MSEPIVLSPKIRDIFLGDLREKDAASAEYFERLLSRYELNEGNFIILSIVCYNPKRLDYFGFNVTEYAPLVSLFMTYGLSKVHALTEAILILSGIRTI